jgi:small-conductance mechanosensitive channel
LELVSTQELPEWLAVLLEVAAAGIAGFGVHLVASRLLGRLAAHSPSTLFVEIVHGLRPASRLIFPLLGIQLAMPGIEQLSATAGDVAKHALVLLTVFAGAWLAIGLVGAVSAFFRAQYPVDVEDNLRAREVQTRLDVLHRCLVIVIAIVASAVGLMTFPAVRQIGATLLASAGIAGLALGLAARPVLENLIAGLQLALTQPIRLDDVVIVEGEWGRIEEITTTYIVVRIWDDRRLIVPIARFIDQPFQNWTRRTADLLGSIFLYTDYSVPVDRIREALHEIVKDEPLWDGRVCVLQVTDATDRALQLRALVSAADASRAWDLRVAVREKLVAFLQREYPECLPRLRVDPAPDEAAVPGRENASREPG